jgi:flavin-dependent dehydrogenase
MFEQLPIAIVGGGPAGALAAELLATCGREVLLFDEKLAWEKPCGGGLTHKALTRYPFLGEARADSKLIQRCELASPDGRRVRFELRHPLAIYSRFALNGLLLARAERSGADIRKERVTRISGGPGSWSLRTPARNYNADA